MLFSVNQWFNLKNSFHCKSAVFEKNALKNISEQHTYTIALYGIKLEEEKM